MKLIIVSGLSGSGKSIALNTLEDCGFYCIDNLPVALVEKLIEQVSTAGDPSYRKTAIGIDSRTNSQSLATFPETLALMKTLNIDYEIVFLQADPKTLLKRFSETRRKHPLTKPGLSLSEAIALERKLLDPVADRADLIIDTSRSNVHELVELIRVRVGLKNSQVLSILFQSFGFKNGIPLDTDFVFDARCLPNPHWDPALRNLTGKDPPVVQFLDHSPVVREYLQNITAFLQRWLPNFEAENRIYFSISIGCT
ncbi:MAG: RNase adapter RapZ, partial [Methylococcales bacterium]